jgi:hypothetical protein
MFILNVDSMVTLWHVNIMTEDKMVIPLRVPVELGREWKVEAAKAGKSVQKWLLGRMNFTEPVRGKQGGALDRVATEKGGSTPLPTTIKQSKSIGGVPVGPLVERLPGEVEEPKGYLCFKCKTRVAKWTMDARGKPWCDDCLEDARNAIP